MKPEGFILATLNCLILYCCQDSDKAQDGKLTFLFIDLSFLSWVLYHSKPLMGMVYIFVTILLPSQECGL